MRGQQTAKKPAQQAPLRDWHKADIKAALEKRGWTMTSLAAHHNLRPSTLRDAYRWSYPAAERRIAAALELHPRDIWPSRYDEHGNRMRTRRTAIVASAGHRSTGGGLSPRRVKGPRSN